MICPKCQHEMGDKLVCDICGFTFRVPESENKTDEQPSIENEQNTEVFDLSKEDADSGEKPTESEPKIRSSGYSGRSYDIPDYVAPSQRIPAHTVSRTIPRTAAVPLSPGKYIGLILLSCIPLAGLILCIIWASRSNGNQNRTNFALAVLIIKSVLIMFALGAVAMYALLNSPLFIFVLK